MGYDPGPMRLRPILLLCLAVAVAPACDRRIEPFDPDEQVEEPDLARIFPEGARVVAEREREGGAPTDAPPAPPGGRGATPAVADAGPAIRGTLELAPELAGSVPRGGVLFLVARNPQGGPPVAVKRIAGPSFPMAFEIGPGDRMIQSIPFAGPLLLTARVDGDGNATSREPGDLSGAAPGPVEPGADAVTIRIDQKL
jgi:cytochrome c-type biogenesis protein CcmH